MKVSFKVIENEHEYNNVLQRINELFDAKPGSQEGAELDLLALIVEKYENEKYPVLPPDPIDSIKERMTELGLKDKDLVPYLGSKSRVSEILNRKRPLTLKMIYGLHKLLDIPLEVFINEKSFEPVTEKIEDAKWMDIAIRDDVIKMDSYQFAYCKHPSLKNDNMILWDHPNQKLLIIKATKSEIAKGTTYYDLRRYKYVMVNCSLEKYQRLLKVDIDKNRKRLIFNSIKKPEIDDSKLKIVYN